jgi:hypothetical protein
MPDPFIENFFVSNSYAQRIYELTRDQFKGAQWVATPLNDDGPTNGGLAKWWRAQYDALAKNINIGNEVDDYNKSVVEKLQMLDDFLQGKSIDPTPGDVGTALINSLKRLEQSVPDSVKGEPGGTRAIDDLRNASFSAAMSAVVIVENDARKGSRPESLDVTFNEVRLRDVTATLHELVGDPPKNFQLNDNVGWSFDVVCDVLKLDNLFEAGTTKTLVDEFRKPVKEAQLCQMTLKSVNYPVSGRARTDWEADYCKTMANLTETLTWVTTETRLRAAESPDPDHTGPAAEFCMLAVEAVRPALGMEARGTDHNWTKQDIKEMQDAGREAAESIRERVGEEEKERL